MWSDISLCPCVDAPVSQTIQSNLNIPMNPEGLFAHMLKTLIARLTAPIRRILGALSSSRAPFLAQSDYDQMRRVMLK